MRQAAGSVALDIALMRANRRGVPQKELAAVARVSMSRIHQRIERAKRFADAGNQEWARDSTPETVYWETIAADGVTFSSFYRTWPELDDYVHHRQA